MPFVIDRNLSTEKEKITKHHQFMTLETEAPKKDTLKRDVHQGIQLLLGALRMGKIAKQNKWIKRRRRNLAV